MFAKTTIPVVFLLLGPTACGVGPGRPGDPAEDVIAQVGSQKVTRRQLEEHILETLGGPADAASANSEVKSRLLDQLLEEELIVEAAIRKGLSISDREVEAFSSKNRDVRDGVKRILLQDKFKREVILSGVTVSEIEVQRYVEQHQDEFRRPARAVIRKILLDDIHDAREIQAELALHPERFEELAEARSLAPDRGEPQAYEEEQLPETVRAAVSRMSAGDLSSVVEDPHGFFILMLDERLPEREADPGEVHEQIRRKLLQEKYQARYLDFLASLRASTDVTVFEEELGFAYIRKGQS